MSYSTVRTAPSADGVPAGGTAGQVCPPCIFVPSPDATLPPSLRSYGGTGGDGDGAARPSLPQLRQIPDASRVHHGPHGGVATLTVIWIMKCVSFCVLLIVLGFNRFAQAAVEAVPFRIEESRVVVYGDDQVYRTPPCLKVILSLTGPEAESSVRYGALKLDEAVDDQGTSLIPARDAFNEAAKFKDYSNEFFRKSNFGGKVKPAAPQMELNLAQPKRSATRIARLRGCFSLADLGTLQTVELAALKGVGKKELPLPAGAPLSITAEVGAGEDVRSIGIEITGDEGALESIEIVDAAGKKVASGISSWSINGGPARKSLSLNKPLDNSMKLVAKVALNRKISKVAFDLKDIALP
jgi:hypothetical protein